MSIKKLFPQKLKNIYHLLQAILANLLYNFPSRYIKVIGVTGTNGKTTTVQMVTKILEEAGCKMAMSSTINFKLGDKELVNATKFTTLSSFSVQKFIKQAVEAQCQYLVLEVSSHSLDQNRLWGIDFETAVITNVTREHLDYHQDMKQYRLAKLRLFKNTKIAVVNLDMEDPEDFLKYKNSSKFLYSIKYDVSSIMYKKLRDKYNNLKLVKARGIELNTNNTSYFIHNTLYSLNFLGKFNVENALAATCVGLSQEISPEVIKSALEKINGVPGRMEHVPNGKGLEIIIDYAVTQDSLNKLYDLIQRINIEKGKIIAVFGACGERDRGKRPIMGEIVAQCADYVIVTNEDSYHEDPKQIMDEVFSGVYKCKTENKDCWRVLDRREAIKKALRLAKPGDIVVITGKGAEETMAVGDKRIPWNDKEVILEELAKL